MVTDTNKRKFLSAAGKVRVTRQMQFGRKEA